MQITTIEQMDQILVVNPKFAKPLWLKKKNKKSKKKKTLIEKIKKPQRKTKLRDPDL